MDNRSGSTALISTPISTPISTRLDDRVEDKTESVPKRPAPVPGHSVARRSAPSSAGLRRHRSAA
jgi:hypothetical protein